MTIKTKSIYEHASQEDGLRVLITRFYPRGVTKDHFDLWLRELSPSADLLMKYKQGKIEWHDFIFQLKHELYANVNSWETINKLSNDAKKRDITLLCYERGNELCHRYIVRDIIEQPSSLAKFVSEKNADDDDHHDEEGQGGGGGEENTYD
jgi:uncharacterized protein YeaO (DUF488 family)